MAARTDSHLPRTLAPPPGSADRSGAQMERHKILHSTVRGWCRPPPTPRLPVNSAADELLPRSALTSSAATAALSALAWVKVLFGRILAPLAQPPEQGALPQLYAATAPDVKGGEFIGPDGFAQLRGGPTQVQLSTAAADPQTGRRLWEVSEQLTDVRFLIPATF